METGNVKRRDILDFDNYMDLKKPGFGGPNSAKQYRDDKGNKLNKNPKLAGYQRTVERHPAFDHPVNNPTYKAMSNDLVYKQEKKKPYNYEDPYHTAIPVKMVSPIKEGRSYTSFTDFINETEEERISVRNADLAEDILFDRQIDWDGFSAAPRGVQGRAFTKNGEVVAYFDQDARELVVLPGAETMDPEAFKKQFYQDDVQNAEVENGFEDEAEFDEKEADTDPDYSEEAEDSAEYEKEPEYTESSELKDIERVLRSFETEEDKEEEY